MNNHEILNVGDWINVEGDYGIVEKIHPVYYDIYDEQVYQPEEAKAFYHKLNPETDEFEIGNIKWIILQVRRFCDYNGKPIRRNRIVVCSKESCRLLRPKDFRIIEKAKKKFPKEYDSFMKINKNMTDRMWIEYCVDGESVRDMLPDFFNNIIKPALPEKFTSDDLADVMKKNNCPIRLDNPVGWFSDYSLYKEPLKVSLWLYYDVGDYVGKKTLFNRLEIYYPKK